MDGREKKQRKTEENDCILKICDSGDTDITHCTLKVLKVLQ